MLFSRETEDDDDFFPNPKYKSNLASIFNNGPDSENSSLTYTPPKQPKAPNIAAPSVVQPTTSTSSTITVAKTVQTFKMVDGAYQSQGKLGAVVVSSCGVKEPTYQLLLYKDKRTHICIAKINRDFKFHIQPKNYASFYDKNNSIWSILFDSGNDLVDFALQVALAKWRMGDSTIPMLVQDLWCPMNESSDSIVELGDSVELTYTAHTIEGPNKDKEESLNANVEMEEKGWKQALLGARPTAKRVIIVQPLLLDDLNPRLRAYDGPVILKLTVLQVNKRNSKIPDPTTILPPEPQSSLLRPQPNTTTTDDTTENPKATKADLITRMARMGQALPFKTVAPPPSDSDETEEDLSGQLSNTTPRPRTRLHHAPKVVAPPISTSTQMAGAAGPVVGVTSTIPSPVTIVPHQMTLTQPYMMGGMYPVSQIDNQAQFNVFFSEVRTTNSELRMGITRLTDKVEAIHSKLDSPDRNQPNHEMMSVLERLMQHEQQLKDQLQIVINSFQNSLPPSGSAAPVAPSTSSLADHVPKTPAVPSTSVASNVDPCTMCIQHEESLVLMTERIKKLEEENEYLKTTSNAQKEAIQNARLADQDQTLRIKELQSQLSEERSKVSTLNERLEAIQVEKAALTEDIEKKNNSLVELQNIILEKQSCIDKLEQAVTESEAKSIDEVRMNLKEVMDQKLIVEEHAKKIFNAVYRMIKMQLKPQTNYSGAFILSVLADTIRAVTMEYLQNGDLAMSSRQRQPLDGASSNTSVEPIQEPSSINQILVEGQYMRKEQRSPLPVEAKLSATIFSDPPSEAASSQHSTVPHQEISVIVDKSERFHPDDSLTSVLVAEESKDGKLEAQTSLPNVASSDESSDVCRPQPPPPPLFDDEENDDMWLN